jgi:hypothetical protein
MGYSPLQATRSSESPDSASISPSQLYININILKYEKDKKIALVPIGTSATTHS